MFHTRRKNFSELSDFKTNWDNEKKECILHLTIPGSTMTIELPCVEAYKYLGIKINRSLTIKDHLLYIKRKVDYITNSLIAIRKAGKNVKFCHNSWSTFIRPLLDYSQTYLHYCTQNDRANFEVFYRQTMRKMLFLHVGVPNEIINCLINYDYKNLNEQFVFLANQKYLWRLGIITDTKLVRWKVLANVNTLDLKNISWIWIETVNIFYSNKICPLDGEKMSRHHAHSHVKEIFDCNMDSVTSNIFIKYLIKPDKYLYRSVNKIYKIFKP